MKKIEEHEIHSYVRSHYTDKGDKVVYKCVGHPLCTHTITVQKKNRSLMVGRVSVCPQCTENHFVLTAKDLQLKTPKCIHCKGGEKAKNLAVNKGIMDSVLGDVFGNRGGI